MWVKGGSCSTVHEYGIKLTKPLAAGFRWRYNSGVLVAWRLDSNLSINFFPPSGAQFSVAVRLEAKGVPGQTDIVRRARPTVCQTVGWASPPASQATALPYALRTSSARTAEAYRASALSRRWKQSRRTREPARCYRSWALSPGHKLPARSRTRARSHDASEESCGVQHSARVKPRGSRVEQIRTAPGQGLNPQRSPRGPPM